MIISIDPGSKEAGVALFDDGELVCAWLSKTKDTKGIPNYISLATTIYQDIENHSYNVDTIDRLVGERPQVYMGTKLKGDPNDLVTIAIMLGAITGLLSAWLDSVIIYKPREWKKQAPKHVVEKRIKNILSAEEKERIELPSAAGLQHNVFDAIGIGLKYLGRYRA